MPTYLCHGFRWQRRSIRVYVIVQNLDDASPEWIIPARASRCILKSFYSLFDFIPYCAPVRGAYTPSQDDASDDGSYILHNNNYTTTASDTSRNRSRSRGRSRSQSLSQAQSRSQSRAQQQQQQQPPLPPLPADPPRSATPDDDFSAQSWSAVKLLEEYDPHDLSAVSRPYAYVADYAVRIDLSCSIADEIARYEQQQQLFQQQSYHPSDQKRKPTFLEQLRDQLQRGEEIRWYVVINDDEVRDASSPDYHAPRRYQQQPPSPGQQPLQQWYYPPGRQPPTREQVEHHAQYMLQQRIFEGDDRQRIWDLGRKKDRKRDRSREQSRGRRGAEYKEPRPPIVPDKDYLPPLPTGTAVPLRPKMSLDTGLGRPKTPGGKGGGLRRLFGRNKVDVGYSP
ncbi:hypothetical protein MMYC01_203616 [Madurella mycetomatis]|uniref:Uncharacterized protein n=1 Tax=Madurella mycetomatis TaxID=100816 RepID=A0A175W9X5_9PEZI|nr:hypothetical protein MMYC01_203616 [Madurella mycetomatis]